jgi:hypothetical protein
MGKKQSQHSTTCPPKQRRCQMILGAFRSHFGYKCTQFECVQQDAGPVARKRLSLQQSNDYASRS